MWLNLQSCITLNPKHYCVQKFSKIQLPSNWLDNNHLRKLNSKLSCTELIELNCNEKLFMERLRCGKELAGLIEEIERHQKSRSRG